MDGERERGRETQRDRWKDRAIDDRERDGWIGCVDRRRERETERQRQIDRETKRQTEKNRGIDRWMDGLIDDRERETHRQKDT